jgi:hypothetical protein
MKANQTNRIRIKTNKKVDADEINRNAITHKPTVLHYPSILTFPVTNVSYETLLIRGVLRSSQGYPGCLEVITTDVQ